MELNEIKNILNEYKTKIDEYGGYFDVDNKIERIKELENITSEPNFWNDNSKVENIMGELNNLKEIVHNNKELKEIIESNLEMLELIEDEEDLKEEIINSLDELKNKIDNLELYTLLGMEYDKNNCILELHSGAGGTEACDWTNMLYRMYLRYMEKHNFKVEVISYLEGEETGIKSVSLKVSGPYAYGYLKCEKGVHRLVRLSPFDANNKRHTSFASVDVIPEFKEVSDVKIEDKDLKIDVYRSSGAGGQHINTTDSAVRITHLPTKIVVSCQNQRSQIQNREEAMEMLKSKLKLLEIEKRNKEINDVKGENLNIEFGSQIRSYVMHPYSLVKDHRTGYETSNVIKVLDGEIDEFIKSYLKLNAGK
ncbi:MAG: peptide chain release factor 2 [Bacilli bacterium]|nr:peptide chain release factor 2 [Bacilli bacterium]